MSPSFDRLALDDVLLDGSRSRRRKPRRRGRRGRALRAAAGRVGGGWTSAGGSLLREVDLGNAGLVAVATGERDAAPGGGAPDSSRSRRRRSASRQRRSCQRAVAGERPRAPGRPGCEGSVQWETLTVVSEPGPSSSSQTVVAGIRLRAPAAAVLDDPVGGVEPRRSRCPSRPTAAAGRAGSGRRRRRPRTRSGSGGSR